eukprot:1149387-Pelagomonas_calceolata.AAC.7
MRRHGVLEGGWVWQWLPCSACGSECQSEQGFPAWLHQLAAPGVPRYLHKVHAHNIIQRRGANANHAVQCKPHQMLLFMSESVTKEEQLMLMKGDTKDQTALYS